MVTQAQSGAWSLAPGSDLTASQLRAAIEAMGAAPEFEAGPEDEIAKAIMELISLTQRPPSKDDVKEAPYVEGLCRMAWEYPIDVVRNACRNWRRIPGSGRWWPEEQDLRAQCDELVKSRKDLRDEAASLLRMLERREQGGRKYSERSSQPHGRTLAFFNDVMASHGPAFCRSWLGRTCDFSEDMIFTLGISVDKLNTAAGGLLTKHGVKVVRCEHTTKRVYDDEDARAADRPAPRKRGYGQ